MTRREQRRAQRARLADLHRRGWHTEADLFLLRAVVLVRPTIDARGMIGMEYKFIGPAGQGTETLNQGKPPEAPERRARRRPVEVFTGGQPCIMPNNKTQPEGQEANV